MDWLEYLPPLFEAQLQTEVHGRAVSGLNGRAPKTELTGTAKLEHQSRLLFDLGLGATEPCAARPDHRRGGAAVGQGRLAAAAPSPLARNYPPAYYVACDLAEMEK